MYVYLANYHRRLCYDGTELFIIMFQGNESDKHTIIGNEVWIGQNVIMTTGRRILGGTFVALETVLT